MVRPGHGCLQVSGLYRAAWRLHVFFFRDTGTTEIYTLSLHDALPISLGQWPVWQLCAWMQPSANIDRKSTRLNSSHPSISYAVFCLKKKKIFYNLLHINDIMNYARSLAFVLELAVEICRVLNHVSRVL